ncbi:MAG: hypothetical protein U0610_16880 [bacterium]
MSLPTLAADSPSRRAPGVAAGVWLAMDAPLSVAAIYLAIRAGLQGADGVLAPGAASTAVAGWLAVLAALGWIARATALTLRRPRELVLEAGFIGVTIAVPVGLAVWGGNEGISWLWLAQEWAKIPANFVLLGRLTPWIGWAGAALFALHVVFAALTRDSRRAGLATALVPIAIAATLVVWLSRITAGARIIVYLIAYVLPWAVAAVGLARGRARLAARAAAIGVTMGGLLVHYLGVLPFGHADFASHPGVTRIYPVGGAAPEVPLAFLRDFELDSGRNAIYSAYGPTSGILRLDLGNGTLAPIEVGNGLVRHLRPSPDPSRLLALDWVLGTMLRISKDPFAIEPDAIALKGPGRRVPMSFLVGSESAYVVYTELPSVAEVDLASGAIRRTLSFRDQGLTRYRSGAWEAVGDAERRFLVVELGAVDAAGRYLLVRVDLDTLTVVAQHEVPDGGLAILWVPERNAIFTAGFFTDRVFELDATTLAPRRTIVGPLNVRAMAYDARRDLLLAIAFLPGELWAIRYGDEAVLARERVGNKSMSLALDPATDRLYLGSEDGVFRVELGAFLGEAQRAPAAGAG